MQVTKRDGTLQSYDVSKIKKCIDWATDKINVNPLELEATLSVQLTEGVKTSDIHASCIDEALKLCTPDDPNWRYVAGRLLYMEWLKKVSKIRQLKNPYSYNFFSNLKDKVSNQVYDSKLLDLYTELEIETVSSYLVPNRDLDYDYAGTFTLIKRYLIDNELPQEMYLVLAMFLAGRERNSEDKLNLVKRIYDAISLRKISLATPILMNLRKPNGNLSSCFILSIDDNIHSIFDGIKDAALISKNGGGVGINVSKIRAEGSSIKGKSNASGGVIPFIKILNDTALAVDQGGRRAGAFTIGLDIWHLDIENFLRMQVEEGDSRKKAFDIFPQVVVPDFFMHMKQKNEDWLLVDPHEVHKKFGFDLTESWGDTFISNYLNVWQRVKELDNYKVVKANDLWKVILRTQTETGLPYLFFKDTANKFNPNQGSGYIPQANLCVAPETLLLTREGNLPIGSLEGKEVEVWNGKQWSKVLVRKTRDNAPLLKVSVRDSLYCEVTHILCTPDHKFYEVPDYTNFYEEGFEIKAQDLKKGTFLLPTTYPNSSPRNWEVMSVEDTKTVSSVYCVTEPLRHKVIFNGILTGNCTESYSNVSPDQYTHCCNLVSINLANVLEEDEEREIADTAVLILENAVELTEPPIPEAKAHNNYYRTIGVGFMGLADWLAYHHKNYYTGKDFAKSMFERYAKYCIKSSVMLAKEYGTFGAFEGSEWAKGNLLGRPLEWFLENTDNPSEWLELSQQVKEYGIRHSQLMAIAPNTNTSLLQGCTASILPPYNSFFYDSNGKGKYPIAPPYYDTKKWYYNENINMEQKVVVDFIAEAITPFIDSGVSMELNFNTNNPQNTPKYISETLQLAWQKGCKTVYYVRSVTQKSEEQCVMCSN